jgi:hypothetical protein
LPASTKDAIKNSVTSVQIVPADEVEFYAIEKGASQQEAEELATIYQASQLNGLKQALFFLVVISIFSFALSRGIPNKISK